MAKPQCKGGTVLLTSSSVLLKQARQTATYLSAPPMTFHEVVGQWSELMRCFSWRTGLKKATHLDGRLAANAPAKRSLVVAVHANSVQLDHAFGKRDKLQDIAKGLSGCGSNDISPRAWDCNRTYPWSAHGPKPGPTLR